MEDHSRAFTRGRILATAVSKMVTKTLRIIKNKDKTDGSRRWDTVRPTLVEAFAREEARNFDYGYCA